MMLLGIDIGTTGVKALLFDTSRKNYHFAQQNYDLIFPKPSYVEQDPHQIWKATKQVIREVTRKASDHVDVTSLSLSSQGGTLIPLGKDGKPLYNAIVWMDHRPGDETVKLREKFGDDFFYLKTGWRLAGCLPLLQICWLKEKRPSLFKKIDKFAFVGDYITYNISGEWVIDPSSAAITMLYNLRRGSWDEELLEIADISEDQLPEIMESGEVAGHVLPCLRNELGFSDGESIVSNGGHDQYCASLGAGALREGDLLLSGGTAWVLLFTLNRLIFDTESYLSPGRHVVRGRWGLLSSIPAGGAGMNWFKTNWSYFLKEKLDDKEFFSELENRSCDVPAGCNGLFFFPHFVGSSAPTWETRSRAVIFGLGLHHDPVQIFKALLEGVGFEVLWNIKTFESFGVNVKSVSMIGGATKSSVWPQIISDMLNLPIKIPRIQEAACLGAAILAGVGAQIFHDCQEGAEQLISDLSFIYPDEKNAKEYKALFLSYQKIFWKLREAFIER